MALDRDTLMRQTIAEACQVLRACQDALSNDHLKAAQANFLSNCADDYTRLGGLWLKYIKRYGREPAPADCPELKQLCSYLDSGDYSAALEEAKRIRAAMKPILVQARAQLKA